MEFKTRVINVNFFFPDFLAKLIIPAMQPTTLHTIANGSRDLSKTPVM
ncbi:MAG: hypothetical protein JXB48_05160 [Candidatus Latescibacteria bacterium]|nr:hypothetical protein [Candidatus Latescibacterota bacterium]